MTVRRRFGEIMTLLLRRVSAGFWAKENKLSKMNMDET